MCVLVSRAARCRYEPGTVAVWDNRVVAHTGTVDFRGACLAFSQSFDCFSPVLTSRVVLQATSGGT